MATKKKKSVGKPLRVFTPKQERFCQEYVVDLNGTRAYRVAYTKSSAKSAESAASRMLRNVKVNARISELQKYLQEATKIDAHRVLDEIAKIRFSNIPASSH